MGTIVEVDKPELLSLLSVKRNGQIEQPPVERTDRPLIWIALGYWLG